MSDSIGEILIVLGLSLIAATLMVAAYDNISAVIAFIRGRP